MYLVDDPTQPIEQIVGAKKLLEELGELVVATAKHINNRNTHSPCETRVAFLEELADVIAICNFVATHTPLTQSEWVGLWERVAEKHRKYLSWLGKDGIEASTVRTAAQADVVYYVCNGRHREE